MEKLVERFKNYEISDFTEQKLILAFLCTIAKLGTYSIEKLVLQVLADGLENNSYLEEFAKCGLDAEFWKLVDREYGYNEETPNLLGFVLTLFTTAFKSRLTCNLPDRFFRYVGKTSAISLLESMMNNVNYQKTFEGFSSLAVNELRLKDFLNEVAPADLLECDVFEDIDNCLISWIKERLLAEDYNAKLCDLSLAEVCEKRTKTYFGKKFYQVYRMIQAACKLLAAVTYECPSEFDKILDQYVKYDYLFDRAYRDFYTCYNHLEEITDFSKLRELVENIYTNEYLAKLLPAWNRYAESGNFWEHCLVQRDFYNRIIKPLKEKTVVIISDALRYEVGMEIFNVMMGNQNSVLEKSDYMLSVIPSTTEFGMAALLPHTQLSIDEKEKVLADGFGTGGVSERLAVLRTADEKNYAVRFDDIYKADRDCLREMLTGKRVIYVYHNQIDSRGEALATENEVFDACAEAVKEIVGLIRKISGSGNTYHFIVTADHGFIYKYDKLKETDKIVVQKGFKRERRFLITDDPVCEDGVACVSFQKALGMADNLWILFPTSSNVFKAKGGANYGHGGSSPQEMIIPLLEFKMEKGHVQSHKADIEPISFINKITNLTFNVEFLQKEAVSDVIKPAQYRVYFSAENVGKISNENIIVADSCEEESAKRITKVRFNLSYKEASEYSFVIEDKDTGAIVKKYSVVLDLPCTEDYGF